MASRRRRPPQMYPSLAAPTPTPTPILKKFAASSDSSSARNRSGASSSAQRQLSVAFTCDAATVAERHAEENREAEGMEESDTDVGSHGDGDDDGSFVDCPGEEAYGAGKDERKALGAANSLVRGEAISPPPSVSRVGAKVRRLNLDDFRAGAPMDVKKSLARSSLEPGREGSPRRSPARKRGGGRRIGGQSPTGRGEGRGKENAMSARPPSTAKKGRSLSRLFADGEGGDASPDFRGGRNAKEEDADDISPRDVAEFPFFSGHTPEKGDGRKHSEDDSEAVALTNTGRNDVASLMTGPPSHSKGSGLVGCADGSMWESNGVENNASDDNSDSVLAGYAPRSTRKKRPARKKADLNDTALLMSSPPKGLRSVGRANSFMQMFSQEVIAESAMAVDEDTDGDKGGAGSFVIRRPVTDAEPLSQEDAPRPIPSPRRPVRGQPRGPASLPRDGSSSTSFSRFVSDFEVVGILGNGSFGCVYEVRNRTDRRMYAIKAARREARGASDRDRMLREVYALAALSDHVDERGMHVVRYHQAWMEGNRLYIQTELCESTLPEEIKSGKLRDEKRRYKLLREMLLALDLVHKSGMIHLDIKPENIFIKNDQYKLGDFGLVSKISSRDEVEEGDSRYMSLELLSDDHSDLTKSDIFSLGATMYEVCLDRYPQPLPANGPEWRDMRRGILLPMTGTRPDLQTIVREMMAPDRLGRPSAEGLLRRRQLLSEGERQLIAEKNRAAAANMALDAQMQRFKLMSPANLRKKFHRSNTIC